MKRFYIKIFIFLDNKFEIGLMAHLVYVKTRVIILIKYICIFSVIVEFRNLSPMCVSKTLRDHRDHKCVKCSIIVP